jgi:hypothetical protein
VLNPGFTLALNLYRQLASYSSSYLNDSSHTPFQYLECPMALRNADVFKSTLNVFKLPVLHWNRTGRSSSKKERSWPPPAP